MSRPQHFGWFFSRGFGPQGWGRAHYEWNYDWTKPDLYQQSTRALEQVGLDLIIIEDALSLGSPQTLNLRVRQAYGGPKHDPSMLTPYLFNAHLSGDRFGINLVTDVGSSRHFGLDRLDHNGAYDRAQEWLEVVRKLWHSWGPDSLVADPETHQFANGDAMDAFDHQGEFYRAAGPLNALPFGDHDPVIVSPGGSPRGLAFADEQSDVQLAAAPLNVASIRAYRDKIHSAARDQGRDAKDIRILFVFIPEVVSSVEEAERIVTASREPSEAVLRDIAIGQSSDLETDLISLDLDRRVDRALFGDHVSEGSLRRLLGKYDDFTDASLRDLLTQKAAKQRIGQGSGTVGTAEEIADFVAELGDEAGNDGFIFSGDLHPVTIHRTLGELVPASAWSAARHVVQRWPAAEPV